MTTPLEIVFGVRIVLSCMLRWCVLLGWPHGQKRVDFSPLFIEVKCKKYYIL